MAAFSLDKNKLSLLAQCLTVGIDGAEASGASQDDVEAIAALLAELDAIACRNGSAEITVMADDSASIGDELDRMHVEACEARGTYGRWDGRSSTLMNEQHLGRAEYAAHMAQKEG